MRITAVRVDGFGLLSDLRIENIPEGMTVFLGENEAGKSTLLDFVRGVLFGFPDRRNKAPFHEPLRGGRHGGALEFVDDFGTEYVLERHVGQRTPTLSERGGATRDPAGLGVILGGADDNLFRSVFAFGLGELSTFQSLDSDEIRDLVFSAGVLGAGRSATRATTAIDQRRSTLVRQRRGEAVANELRHELDEIETELRAARHAALELPTLDRERERLAAELDGAKREAERLHRRRRELEKLQTAWPLSRRRATAVAELERLGSTTPADEAIVSGAEKIERVVRERSGRIERMRRHDVLSDDHDRLERELADAREALGVGADHVFPAVPAELAELAREITEEVSALAGERRSLEEQRSHCARDLDRSASLHHELSDGRAVPSVEEIRATARAITEIRGHVRDRDRDEREAIDQARRAELAAPGRRASPVALGAVGLLVAVAVLGFAMAAGGRHLPTALVAAAAAVALAAGAAVLYSSRRVPARVAGPNAPTPAAERREREITRLAAELAIEGDVTEGLLDTLVIALEDQRERRHEIAGSERELDADRDRVGGIDRELRRVDRRLTELTSAAGSLAGSISLAGVVAPEAISAAVTAAGRAARLTEELARITAEEAVIANEGADNLEDLRRIADAAGTCPFPREDPDALLESLAAHLGRARAAAVRRGELGGIIREATADLEIAVGSGPDADRMLRELDEGDVLGWTTEAEQIDRDVVAADDRHDGSLDALGVAERALRDLEESSAVATLELRRTGVVASLRRALGEWAVLGVAEALLRDSLARYERERQPEVIALAAQLFEEVTAGRYVALVPREDEDGGRRRGIDVIGADGRRTGAADLSRGTAEQLYLCLRLAFAATFAERAVALPLVLDDVLVNFDPARAQAMAGAISKTASTHQVLAFTCHPHIADQFCSTGDVHVVELTRN